MPRAHRVLLPLLLVFLATCGPRAPEGDGSDVLVVGTEAAFPPFESVAEDGSLEGFDIDLARALGAELGRRVEFRNCEFSTLIPDLQSGRLDAVCSGMSRTPERAQVVDFSQPYVRVPTGVLVSATLVPEGATLAALDRPDVVAAVQRKTTGEEKTRANLPQAQVRVFDREVDAAQEVADGRAHVFVYDMVSIVKLHAQHAATTRILDVELGTEHYCIAFAKGSPLVADADAFLARESRPGGKVDELLRRWLTDPERFRAEPR